MSPRAQPAHVPRRSRPPPQALHVPPAQPAYVPRRRRPTSPAAKPAPTSTLIVTLIALILQLGSLAAGVLDGGAALTQEAIGLAMTFGAIGACLSALIGFSGVSTDQRIPERTANVLITLTRPLIGAASGLVGLLAVHSKVVNLPGSGVGWLIPFAFGFSERIVLSLVEPKTAKS